MMGVIYCSVRSRTRKAQRWNFQATSSASQLSNEEASVSTSWSSRLFRRREQQTSQGTGASNKMEKAVFQQCLFYLLAFYATWIMFYVSQVNASSTSFAFWLVVVIVTPLQGFFNALVYARPRIKQKWNGIQNKMCKQQHLDSGHL